MWTGTTYALAAGMILEAFSFPPTMIGINDVLESNDSTTLSIALENEISIKNAEGQGPDFGIVSIPKGLLMNNQLESISPVSQQTLLKMAFTTAQGIHDAVSTYRTCVCITIEECLQNTCIILNFKPNLQHFQYIFNYHDLLFWL